ncbi:MAG: MFS transporter [Fidelibacterota bacterium]|nr:MAG: MFS transporter [Candidatus Neomarinimicrobiota bacterium]
MAGNTIPDQTNSKYQWLVLGLLFAGTTINYIDRTVLSVLLPEIEKEIFISPVLYGIILGSFQFTYTVGLPGFGFIIDRVGTKLGYLASITAWSFSSALHGLASSGLSLAVWRGIFGLAASGNFPAAIKSVSEWFKIEKRAFATALFNSGASIASIIGPPLIVIAAMALEWRLAFVVFGSLGIFLAIAWHLLYRKPDKQEESSGISKDEISQLIRQKPTIGIIIGKFLTDPVWWFFLYWMPTYLNKQRGFGLESIAIAIPSIYIIATLMGFVGGWIPGYFMKLGWSVEKARKTTMLLSAMIFPFTVYAVFAENPWMTIILVGIACGAHNSWSANIFTMCSDCFKSEHVGSVTGIAGFAGGAGGVLLSALIPGFVVQYFGYIPVFVLMGILHPLAYLVVRSLVVYDK